MRVLIADDEVLLREGLERLLAEAGLEVVGTAGNPGELLRQLQATRPDVAIVDIKMPPTTHTDEGLAAAQQIRAQHPRSAVLVLSHYLNSGYAMQLLGQHPGGVGYLLKERVSDLALLTDALARLHEGECVIDPTILARLVHPHSPGQLGQLTGRERDVLAPIAKGYSNQASASGSTSAPKQSKGTSNTSSRNSASKNPPTATGASWPC